MCGTFELSELVEPCVEECEAPVKQSNPAQRDLVRGPQSAQEMTYREFVERYQSSVYRVAYGILANRKDADEVAQRVFVKAQFSLTSFDCRRSLFIWVYRIVVNESYGFLRKKCKKVLHKSDSADNFVCTPMPMTRDAYPTPDRVVSQRDLLNELLERIPGRGSAPAAIARTRRIFCGTTGRGDRHERTHDQGCAVSDATAADPGLRPKTAK